MKNNRQRGVALVITLIMLSIITFLAVAFLAISRRDKASVSGAQNQSDSRMFAEAGAARAQSELIARMLARSNLLVYDALVSRNYIRTNGFDPGLGLNRENVNYDYKKDGTPNFTDLERVQNIANLFYDPRVPVFVRTNNNKARPLDFRFYLDLNRNGQFDPSGLFYPTNDARQKVGTNRFMFTGDPEWIGILANPMRPHAPDNRFIGRYAYFVVPVGKTLDLNFIHNYTKANIGNSNPQNMDQGDRFQRSQGFGSWEINLGAFFVDLNTNTYVRNANLVYNYRPLALQANDGDAFIDALSILKYRYRRHNLSNLASVGDYYYAYRSGGGNPNAVFRGDFIDGYATSPLLTAPFRYTSDPDAPGPGNKDKTNLPWPGSDNTNRFLNLDELFDAKKTSPQFVDRLRKTMAATNSYDRYTYYRLLSQLGVDSGPELAGKINLNYSNDFRVNVAPTNFVPWTPIGFFTNTAERLLRGQYAFGHTNIQIYPTNAYTPGVHRLLQVAANLYDATTNRGKGLPAYPSVFRPLFTRTPTNIIISGYEEVTNTVPLRTKKWYDLGFVASNNVNLVNANIYGVPWVIGAKKGYPNFNEYSLQTAFSAARKLEFLKAANTARPYQTNQMYVIGISNHFGTEFWNSYTQAFQRTLWVEVTNVVSIALTNVNGVLLSTNRLEGYVGKLNPNTWQGWNPSPAARARSTNNFFVPRPVTVQFVPPSKYRPGFNPLFSTNIFAFDRTGRFPTPDFGIVVTNRLLAVLIDAGPDGNPNTPDDRIVDLVSFGDLGSSFNVNQELGNEKTPVAGIGGTAPDVINRIWRTNRLNNATTDFAPTVGVNTQIGISLGTESISDADWRSYNSQTRDKVSSIETFKQLMTSTNRYATNFYTPFDPGILLIQTKSWQANDPLVHYTTGDMTDTKTTNIVEKIKYADAARTNVFTRTSFYNLGKVNRRYNPWNGHPDLGEDESGGWNVAIKDPLIFDSDSWEFPTNKFGNVGWIGRVHRGTPWQTIYLKSEVANPQAWTNYWVNTLETHPTNDWRLADYFTVAPNDNAARGLLSVNQDGLAAWSAVLSGTVVLSNSIPSSAVGRFVKPQFTALVNEPNSASLHAIVDELNELRKRKPNQVFESVGDIFASTNLTAYARHLNLGDRPGTLMKPSPLQKYTISDEAYESIPQQILSLVRLGEPRFVVYSYGQSLKPADQSLVLNPPGGNNTFFNLCTNYQITGEVVTRTVMKVTGTVLNPTNIIESYSILSSD